MSSIRSVDGTDGRIFDEGHGPGILIFRPGSDDGTAWVRVARLLAERHRVIRVVRRHIGLGRCGVAIRSRGRWRTRWPSRPR